MFENHGFKRSLFLGMVFALLAQCHFAPQPKKKCLRKGFSNSVNSNDSLSLTPTFYPESPAPIAIEQVAWPQNCYEPVGNRRVSQVVLHNTLETLEETMAIFRDCQTRSRVSIHYIVDRTGKIYSAVPESDIAWHAGDRRVNAESIGIEIVAYEGNRGMTPEQEESVILLVKDIMIRHDLNLEEADYMNHSSNENYAELEFYSPLTTHRVVTNGSVDGAKPDARQGTQCPNHIWETRDEFLSWRKISFSKTSGSSDPIQTDTNIDEDGARLDSENSIENSIDGSDEVAESEFPYENETDKGFDYDDDSDPQSGTFEPCSK